MHDVSVRIAAPSEFVAFQAVYLSWGYRGGIAQGDRLYVAESVGAPIGLVRRTVEAGVTMLRGMQVAATHQHQGIGRRLLAAFVADLGDATCYCIPYAHLTSFYGAAGFHLVEGPEVPPFLRNRERTYMAEGRQVCVMRRASCYSKGMTDVHRLEREVAALPEAQLAEFRRWYAEFDAERWDRQLTADVESGAFDRIVADALRDHEAGRSRPL